MRALHWLDPHLPGQPFPPVDEALDEPNGLLAIGGDLSEPRLLRAYQAGIFPWYEPGQPILWWAPDPRAVLRPSHVRIRRSLRKALRNRPYTITLDSAFRAVVDGCGAGNPDRRETWITGEMAAAYARLYDHGHAHSVEVWDREGTLVGGLYGVALGRIFYGESMFSTQRDASKIALVYLARQLQAWGYPLIDCQLPSEHLMSLGAELIPRRWFTPLLDRWTRVAGRPAPWRLDPELDVLAWQPEDAEPHTPQWGPVP